jgi:hypothetical protein
LIGIIGGGGFLLLVGLAFEKITGREGMGMGDVKMLAMIGAWMGWRSLLFIILLSSLAGSLIGGIMLVLSRQGAKARIPFGPFLALGTLVICFSETNLRSGTSGWERREVDLESPCEQLEDRNPGATDFPDPCRHASHKRGHDQACGTRPHPDQAPGRALLILAVEQKIGQHLSGAAKKIPDLAGDSLFGAGLLRLLGEGAYAHIVIVNREGEKVLPRISPKTMKAMRFPAQGRLRSREWVLIISAGPPGGSSGWAREICGFHRPCHLKDGFRAE